MKKIQKIMMALALCSISIGAVACSSSKISNEDLVKKVNEATKSVTSLKSKNASTVSIDVNSKKVTTKFDLETEMTKEPSVVKISGKSETSGNTVINNQYITTDTYYFQNNYNKQWYNLKEESTRKLYDGQKNSADYANIVELLTALEKNLKIEQKDSNYEATYSGTDDAIKEPLKKIIIASQPTSKGVLNNDIELEQFDVKFIIDKKTFNPTEFNIKTKFKVLVVKQTLNIDVDFNIKYSDVNGVKEITIPDEVKNSQEWNNKKN